jgi:hypothetical protein
MSKSYLAHKFRLKPTKEQAQVIESWCHINRYVWNHFLSSNANLARNQCRCSRPSVLPCRNSGANGSRGIRSRISTRMAASSRVSALLCHPSGSARLARSTAASKARSGPKKADGHAAPSRAVPASATAPPRPRSARQGPLPPPHPSVLPYGSPGPA